MNRARRRTALALVAVVLIAGCRGEPRPNVDVIGGADTVSVSASSIAPLDDVAKPPGATYKPTATVEASFAMGLDLREMRRALAPARGAPAWAAALNVYEQGRSQRDPNGALRSLATLADDALHAQFPNGPAVYGRPGFVDAIVRDGLAGTGRATGLSDEARAQMVDKGVLMLLYGRALERLDAARARVEAGAAGGDALIDDAFAVLAGAAESGGRPHALLTIAASRERDLKLDGKLASPLEASLVAARTAAPLNDRAAFQRSHAEAKGYLNAIFYLSVLRHARLLQDAQTPAARQLQLAQAWGFWQAIRAAAATGSAAASQDVEAALSRDGTAPWTPVDTATLYSRLNDPAVLRALGIPSTVQIATPPTE